MRSTPKIGTFHAAQFVREGIVVPSGIWSAANEPIGAIVGYKHAISSAPGESPLIRG